MVCLQTARFTFLTDSLLVKNIMDIDDDDNQLATLSYLITQVINPLHKRSDKSKKAKRILRLPISSTFVENDSYTHGIVAEGVS